jgi:hypothetical protein
MQIIYRYLPIWLWIPTGGGNFFSKDATQNSARVVQPRGIAIKIVQREPIFEKCPHLREKGGVLTEIWHIRNRESLTVRFSKITKKQFIEHFCKPGITILNLRDRRSCQGNQNFTRFHISTILETLKMVLHAWVCRITDKKSVSGKTSWDISGTSIRQRKLSPPYM